MNYDREILLILNEAGDNGLSIQKIARHVFNYHNNLFESVSLDEVRRYVAAYLNRNSKSADSPVERAEVRGVYRINRLSTSRQLYFDFKEDADGQDEEENAAVEDRSLSLF